MVTSTQSKAGDLRTADISLGNVTLEIPSSVPINDDNTSHTPESSHTRTSPEGGSPTDTPILAKRVQFADPDGDSDPADSQDDVTTPEDDMLRPPHITRHYSDDVSEDTPISEMEQGITSCANTMDGEHDDPKELSDDRQDRVRFADDVTNNEGKSAYKESYLSHTNIAKSNGTQNGNIIQPKDAHVLHKHQTINNLVDMTSKDNEKKSNTGLGSRCWWAGCCGLGWFMFGALAIATGMLLVMYLKQLWMKQDNESALLYYGIACCIGGGLTILMGLGFWTYACIIWKPSKDNEDPERQTNENDTGRHKETVKLTNKYVVNTDSQSMRPVSAMPHDHMSKSKTQESRTITPDPVTDETFMI